MGNKAVGVAHLWGMEVVETGDVCGVDHEDRLVGVSLVEGEAGGRVQKAPMPPRQMVSVEMLIWVKQSTSTPVSLA